jgi:hypothetical protein
MVVSRVTIHEARFIAFTCDEVITLDNQSWIFVHGYCVQNWCSIQILLLVECIVKGYNAQILTKVILATLVNLGSLIEEEVAN